MSHGNFRRGARSVGPGGIRKVFENWQGDQADALQARISEIRKTIQAYPLIPALKVMTAEFAGDAGWIRTRPPLMPLAEAQAAALTADLAGIAFDMAVNRNSVAA